MDCWHCNSKVMWGSDYDFRDYGIEGHGVVSILYCTECNATYECYKDENIKKKGANNE